MLENSAFFLVILLLRNICDAYFNHCKVCLIFDILNGDYVQRKRKSRKAGNHSTLFLLRRELREGTLQSLFGGSSCVVPSSNAAPDPLLSSFILPMNDDFGSTKSRDMTETSSSKKSSDETLSERYFVLFFYHLHCAFTFLPFGKFCSCGMKC